MTLTKFQIWHSGAFMGYGIGRDEESALLDFACTIEGEKEFMPSHNGNKQALHIEGLGFYMAYRSF